MTTIKYDPFGNPTSISTYYDTAMSAWTWTTNVENNSVENNSVENNSEDFLVGSLRNTISIKEDKIRELKKELSMFTRDPNLLRSKQDLLYDVEAMHEYVTRIKQALNNRGMSYDEVEQEIISSL